MEWGHRGWPNEATNVIKGFTVAELARTGRSARQPQLSRRRRDGGLMYHNAIATAGDQRV